MCSSTLGRVMSTHDDHAQRSLSELGRPISDVTFCVIDVETTGGAAHSGGIIEVGAVRVRGGRPQETLSTLIDPGIAIPAFVTALTGIRNETVADAPPFRDVADDLSSFMDGTVIVGHNIRYDLAFLASEFERAGYPRIQNPSVCTLALARRLIRDEVPDCRLGTLARYLRLAHQPSHRALDDALATTDLFMALLERAGRLGVFGMRDLFALPRLAGHPQVAKLGLTDGLPHAPGVYLFRDRADNVLYVGKASDLRSRVRSYFSSDDRRKIPELLRATASIDHEVCDHPLAAAVREVHLIARHLPRFNSRATRWRSMAYVRLTDEPFPRLTVVRTPPPPASVHLGPLSSVSAAHRVIDAVTTVVPLRRCTAKPSNAAVTGQLALDGCGGPRPVMCTPAQLGVARCPCSGEISRAEYERLCSTIALGFTECPELLLGPLRSRMRDLAARERFEQASEVRAAAAALAEAIRRRRRLDAWRTPARITVERDDGAGAHIVHGLLAQTWPTGARPARFDPAVPPSTGTIRRDEAYERLCVVTELERLGSPWHLVEVDGRLAEPSGVIDRFEVLGTKRHRPDR